jgi:hypothetical protein
MHLGNVIGGRRFEVDRTVAHDIDAQRMVRDLCAEIDRVRNAFKRVEIVRETLPIPFQALGEGDAGDLLDRFHQADQRLVVLAPHRGEADAAVAEQDGGHTMPG